MQATGPAGSQRYTYDDRARLSKVEDTGTEGCVTRVYGFTGDSNRTSLTSYGPDAAGGCQATTVAASSSYSYDSADRLTTSGYVYDRMGRSTTVPKVHTSNADDQLAGDLAVTYAANDMVASLQQTVSDPASGVAQVRKQTFSLDGSDRVSTTKGFTDGVQLSEKLDHYDGESDSPAWTSTKTRPDASTAWTTSWNRFVSDLAGGLAVDVDDAGVAKLQLANLHGDIVATATLGQAGIDSYTETDEYGQPKTGTSARYGWLGTHQRDADTVGGLTLMGARLYNPTTGRFLSIDPVPGGNDNRYTYPADPINKFDVDGKAWWDLAASIASAVSVGACIFGGPLACTVASVVSLAVSFGARLANGERGHKLIAGVAMDAVGIVLKPLRAFRAASALARRAAPGVVKAIAARGSRYVTKLRVFRAKPPWQQAKPWYKPSSYARSAAMTGNRVRFGVRLAYSAYGAKSSYDSYRTWRGR